MMFKSIVRFFIVLFSLTGLSIQAQFLNAVGITIGGTYANQYWDDTNLKLVETKDFVLGFNGSVFAEFLSNDWVRWVSEFQYNQKGSIDRGATTDYTTSLDYLCFNNYLKVRYELLNIIPYVLVGPRLEYLLSGSSASPRMQGAFQSLHLTVAGGLGLELVSYGPFKIFTEAFYDIGVMKAYDAAGLKAINQDIELRIGLKYVFKKKLDDMDCNSPTYVPM